jgi:hypothetical protein
LGDLAAREPWPAGPSGTNRIPASDLLALAKVTTEVMTTCPQKQLGSHVAPIWDSIALAGELLPDRNGRLTALDLHALGGGGPVRLAEGQTTIVNGRTMSGQQVIKVQPTCVHHVGPDGTFGGHEGSRDVKLCTSSLGLATFMAAVA